MDKTPEMPQAGLKEKQLLSKAFETFNSSIAKLRKYQERLESQIGELKVELELKNQELTNVLQSLSNGLIVTNLEGSIQTFNRAASALTAIEPADAMGKHINDVLGAEVIPTQLDAAAYQAIEGNIQTEFSFFREEETLILEGTTTLMVSEEEELQGIILNLNDLTLLKRLEEEAERKNRLTAMGEIAMQVAHEVRNPLGSIALFASMMKKDFTAESEELELTEHILSAVQSMNHIISNLLEYTRPKPIHLDHINLNEIGSEFVEFSRHTGSNQGVELHLNLEATNPIITGNPELIKQILLNIFMNSCQAMEEGGDFYLETQNYVESDPLILERFEATKIPENGELPLFVLTLRDTGKGMSKEIVTKLFEPFFTTREQGTGLGMSIVFKTMASHGGTILVTSKIGEGTQISLLFPQT